MPSVIDVEQQPTPPPGGLLQPTILEPRQQRLPHARQLLAVLAPTIAIRLLTALVLVLEIPPPVLLPPLPGEQPCSAVPWPLEKGLDSAPSPLCKPQKSRTHLQCRRKMLRTT